MNGVDTWRYGPRPRDAALAGQWGLNRHFVVGYMGTHGMAHALGNVLEAADRLRGETNLRFLLVGAGAERHALMEEADGGGSTAWCSCRPSPRRPCPRCGACATWRWCT